MSPRPHDFDSSGFLWWLAGGLCAGLLLIALLAVI